MYAYRGKKNGTTGRKLLLCMVFLLIFSFSAAYAEKLEDSSQLRMRDLFSSQKESVSWGDTQSQPLLQEYLERLSGAFPYEGKPVSGVVDASDPMNVRVAFEVEQAALYTVSWTYRSEEVKTDTYASVMLDGEVPYREAATACFRWKWREKAAPELDAAGDEIRPQQMRLSTENTDFFFDSNGFVAGKLPFYLEPGSHELCISFVSHALDVTVCELSSYEVPVSYETYLQTALEQGFRQTEGAELKLEAEGTLLFANSATIRRSASDDPLTTPYEMGYKRLNTIDGGSFSKGGQMVEWSFEVPSDGLYTISFRCAAGADQLPACRMLLLDGNVPFSEMSCYRIPYQEELQIYTLPYLYALTAGRHTMSLIVNSAEFYPVILELGAVNDELSQLMLELVMLVGANPDPNYDYDVEKGIPDIEERLTALSERLSVQCDQLRELCGGASMAENSLRQNAELLLVIRRNMDRIQNSLTDLNSIQTNLALWEENLQNMPLQLDCFYFGRDAENWDKRSTSIWQKSAVMLNNFLVSFTKDYDQVGARTAGGERVVLDVWAGMSIEEADILKTLCDSEFTSRTGIAINLNIMPAGQLNAGAVNALLLSIVSGTEPDVALGVSTGSPVELAIRGAVVDLSQMPGYEELTREYSSNVLVANSFMGGVYAIPERLDFSVLFYRKDILSALKIALPETWEEVCQNVLPSLYQNGLEMYIPQNYESYCTFLYQYGGQFYSQDGLKVALDTPEAYQAFKTMVEMYTKYAVPYTANFYNKFRTGEIPVGISGFSDYMSLTVGAGNLSGKWGIAVIPGVRRSDGTVSHAISSTVSTSSVLMSSSERQAEGWEFLKWWLSADTQAEYAQEVETRIGMGSRVNTANNEAFRRMNWPADDLQILLAAREQTFENPGVLGGYYAKRHITNAWNSMITDENAVLRDEFENAIEMIQTELDKKQEEYQGLLSQSSR